MQRIIIFASGSGTNAENIIDYFTNSRVAKVTYVVTNNPKAGVIERADRLGIDTKLFSKAEMATTAFLEFLNKNADFIVLAGFLLKIPDEMLRLFPDRIINIHPALLPKYGGKGMYGMHVHKAVVDNMESESGITIHYVNENYDEGAVIFQKAVALTTEDTPHDVAAKIHQLEQENFPQVIENLLQTK
ncbi:phosphoribosylglycinamide formyltransferase [Lutimonas sp.]|uniref:phosphoribosylglycinamide formyltransferase n=1 Tax=Lutimonas sp. TaxID=1872403 RepID=UPI003D9B6C23